MIKHPRRLWLHDDDINAVDIRLKAIMFRTDNEPKTEQTSELDIPVVRINKTTYKLDRNRLVDNQISIYCPVLTIFNQGAPA